MHNRFWLKVGNIKDKKLWLFDLYRDARWSNGELVTTYDVVYSWRRLANPTTDSPMTSVLTEWQCATPKLFCQAKLRLIVWLGVHALDDHTLQVILEEPVPFF